MGEVGCRAHYGRCARPHATWVDSNMEEASASSFGLAPTGCSSGNGECAFSTAAAQWWAYGQVSPAEPIPGMGGPVTAHTGGDPGQRGRRSLKAPKPSRGGDCGARGRAKAAAGRPPQGQGRAAAGAVCGEMHEDLDSTITITESTPGEAPKGHGQRGLHSGWGECGRARGPTNTRKPGPQPRGRRGHSNPLRGGVGMGWK